MLDGERRRGARRLPARGRQGRDLRLPAPAPGRSARASRAASTRRLPHARARARARARRRRDPPLPRPALPHPPRPAGGRGARCATTSGEPIDPDAALPALPGLLSRPAASTRRCAAAQWLVVHEPDELRGALRAGQRLRSARASVPRGRAHAARRAEDRSRQPARLRRARALACASAATATGEIRDLPRGARARPGPPAHADRARRAQIDGNDLDGRDRHASRRSSAAIPDDLRSVVRLGFLEYEAARLRRRAEARFERALARRIPRSTSPLLPRRRAAPDGDDSMARSRRSRRVPPEHEHYAEARTQIASILERRGDYAARAQRGRARARRARPSRQLDLYVATLRAKTGDFDGAVGVPPGVCSTSAPERRRAALQPRHPLRRGEAQGRGARATCSSRSRKNPDNASALNYIGYTLGGARAAISTRPSA